MPRRPCLGVDGNYCGILVESPKRRCSNCESARNRARDAIRGNSTQRGLGAGHRAQVKAMVEAFISENGHPPTRCGDCGEDFTAENPLSGEHGLARIHGGSTVTKIVCLRCNSRAGARIRRLG